MPRPIENEAGLTAPRPEVFLRDLNLRIFKNVLGGLFPLRCGRWPARRVRAFFLFRSFLHDPGPGY